MNKTCNKCGLTKDSSEFSFNKRRKDKLENKCRACISLFHKEQYKKHKKYYTTKAKQQHDENKKRGRERHYTVDSRFSYAKSRATKNGKGWHLSLDDYQKLITQSCHYCSNCLAPKKASGVGLDRIDNTKGYQLDNVLPCCGVCNSIRNDYLSVKETEIAVSAIVTYRKTIPNTLSNYL